MRQRTREKRKINPVKFSTFKEILVFFLILNHSDIWIPAYLFESMVYGFILKAIYVIGRKPILCKYFNRL